MQSKRPKLSVSHFTNDSTQILKGTGEQLQQDYHQFIWNGFRWNCKYSIIFAQNICVNSIAPVDEWMNRINKHIKLRISQFRHCVIVFRSGFYCTFDILIEVFLSLVFVFVLFVSFCLWRNIYFTTFLMDCQTTTQVNIYNAIFILNFSLSLSLSMEM